MNTFKLITGLFIGITLIVLVACQPAPSPTQLPSAPTQAETAVSTTPPGPARPAETIAIFDPKPSQPIQGGELQVSGYSEYFFESNLSLALCGEGGSGESHPVCGTADNVLAQGNATIEAPDIGQPGPFSGSLSYQVEGTVNARLVVYAQSARDGGLLHASSVVVELNP